MISSALRPSAHIASKTSLAILPEIVPSPIRARSPASASAGTRLCVDLEVVAVERTRKLAHHPVGGELGLATELPDDGLEVLMPARGSAVSTPASYADSPKSRL